MTQNDDDETKVPTVVATKSPTTKPTNSPTKSPTLEQFGFEDTRTFSIDTLKRIPDGVDYIVLEAKFNVTHETFLAYKSTHDGEFLPVFSLCKTDSCTQGVHFEFIHSNAYAHLTSNEFGYQFPTRSISYSANNVENIQGMAKLEIKSNDIVQTSNTFDTFTMNEFKNFQVVNHDQEYVQNIKISWKRLVDKTAESGKLYFDTIRHDKDAFYIPDETKTITFTCDVNITNLSMFDTEIPICGLRNQDTFLGFKALKIAEMGDTVSIQVTKHFFEQSVDDEATVYNLRIDETFADSFGISFQIDDTGKMSLNTLTTVVPFSDLKSKYELIPSKTHVLRWSKL